MLPVFDTESGLPLPNINLGQRKGVPDENLPYLVSTAEISTLQLEFRYLSYLTEEETYWEKVESVSVSRSMYAFQARSALTGHENHQRESHASRTCFNLYAVRAIFFVSRHSWLIEIQRGNRSIRSFRHSTRVSR